MVLRRGRAFIRAVVRRPEYVADLVCRDQTIERNAVVSLCEAGGVTRAAERRLIGDAGSLPVHIAAGEQMREPGGGKRRGSMSQSPQLSEQRTGIGSRGQAGRGYAREIDRFDL